MAKPTTLRIVFLLSLTALALATTVPSAAQEWLGGEALGIEVKADKEGPVAGVEVRLHYMLIDSQAGPAPLETGADGRLTVGGLGRGIWRMELSKEGYADAILMVRVGFGRKAEVVGAPTRSADGTPLRVSFFKVKGAAAVPPAPEPPPEPAPAKPTPRPEPPPPVPQPAPAKPAPQPTPAKPAPPPVPQPTPAKPEPPPMAQPEPAKPTPPRVPQPEPAKPAPKPPEAPPEKASAPKPTPMHPPAAKPAPPPVPEPTPEPPKPTPQSVPEPPEAPPRPAPESVPEPPEAPPTTAPKSVPEPPEAAPMPAPESIPEPPETRPMPAPESVPEPPESPPMTAPGSVPEPPEAPPIPAPESVPEPPEAAPMPAPAPAPAAASVPEPPEMPAPAGPTAEVTRSLREQRAGGCNDCKPGEAAVTVEQAVPPGGSLTDAGSPCDPGVAAAVGHAANLLGEPGEAGSVLEAVTHDAGAWLAPYAQADSSCQVVAVVLPAGARYASYRLEATDSTGLGACWGSQECEIGACAWSGQPEVVRAGEATLVWAVFRNASPDRTRRARLTVYYKP